jgi:sphingomyelin phosphodiesterase acid-like 3
MPENPSRRDQRHLPARSVVFALCLAMLPGAARPSHAQQPGPTVQALFVSDIHFEPFWDPAKTSKLAVSPVSKWKAILAAPPSANRQLAFDALQRTCQARGTDTLYPLLRSSVNAMKAHASGALFITLSGDLMAHSFGCKYKLLFPHATPQDYRAFTEKTIRFVMQQLNGVAPGVPVYAGLGNNDSDCGDYQLDAHSPFLSAVGGVMTNGFPARERARALASFSSEGNYTVMLPAPIEKTRLIVLDDVFFSPKHTTCSGKPDPADQDVQLKWLAEQLSAARTAKQNVWVMAHIPPGVDAYATLAHLGGACGRPPAMLLSSDKLAESLTDAADVIKLAIFGHTHEDEIKLLEQKHSRAAEPQSDNPHPDAIPVKIVPSISPVNGNLPSFTVARIDPATAQLVDYQVIAGSAALPWKQLYDYSQAYGETSFSAAAVKDLLTKLVNDRYSRTQASRDYIHNFSTGNPIPLLSLVWPAYVCTMTATTASGFTACACSTKE